ncbi:MAG: hypothetical protein WDM81_13535 [Rhizomicrobium sp.]
MDEDKIKDTYVLGCVSVATGVIFLYDAYEASRSMSIDDFLTWVVICPTATGVVIFGYLLWRWLGALVPIDFYWPKTLAYVFILTPAALLLFAGVVGPLRGLDGVRWMFPVTGA